MTAARWRIAAASVVGSSHLKTGAPCQDAYEVAVLHSAHGDIFVGVTSDGAGSASMSGIGSRTICRRLLESAAVFISQSGGEFSPDEMTIQTWMADARAELCSIADSADLPPREFACTALFAILGNNWAAYAQIGDGAICVPDDNPEEWCWIFWPQKGEYANTTHFLTDLNWTEYLCVEKRDYPIQEIAMFTDGIENLVLVQATSQAHHPFFNRMFPTVRASTARGSDSSLGDGLRKFLASENVLSRTDDDKTLVLATRSPHSDETK